MTLVRRAQWIRVFDDSGEPIAGVGLQEERGNLYAQDLRGHDPGALRAVMREVARLARERPVFFPLRDDPLYARIRSAMRRIGARKYVEVWVLEESDGE